jgi:hypothetical protein
VFALIVGERPTGEHLTAAYKSRLEMLGKWQAAEFQDALAQWNYLGRESPLQSIPVERLALAEMLAFQADPAVLEPSLKAIERDQPTLAEALRGVAFSRIGRNKQAGEMLTHALLSYRSDPWPIPAQMARVLAHLQMKAAEDREQVPQWLAALAQPFAVYVNETARERTRINIAYALGADQPSCLSLFGELEPNMPWLETLLDFRLACYTAHKHPLRQRAELDLARFRDNAPAMFERY